MDWLQIIKDQKALQDALLAKAKEEKREFTDEEQTAFDAAQAEVTKALNMYNAQKLVDDTQAVLDTPADGPTPRVDIVNNPPKWENGIGDMLQAVHSAAIAPGNIDPRLVRGAALGGNEAGATDGGFLIEPEHTPELLKRTYDLSQIAGRCRKRPIGSNRLTQNYVKETSRATGSRMGGVRGYWIDEAGTITASAPKFGQLEWKLKKLAALFYATEEMLEDSTALASFAMEAYGEEFAWLLDEAIYSGNGGATLLGVANSNAKVDVAKRGGQEADTIVYENITDMWARMWARSRANAAWFINQDCEPQLQGMALVVGAGGIPVYMPAGGVSASPYSTLMGRPVIPVEQAATIGDVGDIVLADFSQYQIVDKPGIKQAESIHVQFLTDQRAFRFIYRVDGMPIWQSPLTPANSTATLAPFVRLAERT